MSFNVGDKIKVVKNSSGHNYDRYGHIYTLKQHKGSYWFVEETDCVIWNDAFEIFEAKSKFTDADVGTMVRIIPREMIDTDRIGTPGWNSHMERFPGTVARIEKITENGYLKLQGCDTWSWHEDWVQREAEPSCIDRFIFQDGQMVRVLPQEKWKMSKSITIGKVNTDMIGKVLEVKKGSDHVGDVAVWNEAKDDYEFFDPSWIEPYDHVVPGPTTVVGKEKPEFKAGDRIIVIDGGGKNVQKDRIGNTYTLTDRAEVNGSHYWNTVERSFGIWESNMQRVEEEKFPQFGGKTYMKYVNANAIAWTGYHRPEEWEVLRVGCDWAAAVGDGSAFWSGTHPGADVPKFSYSAMMEVYKLLTGKVIKSKFMNLKSKIKLAVMGEPQKTLVKAGILNENKELTSEGKSLFDEFLFEKFGDEFGTQIAPLVKEEKE